MTKARRTAPAILALTGILVVALNLRTAMTTIPSVLVDIRAEMQFDDVAVGILGAAPPLCFAIFGWFAPWLARQVGLERAIVVALAVLTVGHVLRGFAHDASGLIAATILALGAVGVGSVLLPAVIKRYFPSRISSLTAAVGFVFAISAGGATLLTPAVASVVGWRMSLAWWGLLSASAIVPWLFFARGDSLDTAAVNGPRSHPALGEAWRSPLAWALAALFAYGTFVNYALFVWLPELLRDVGDVSIANSNDLLALFALMGIPMNIIIVILGGRRGWHLPLIVVGIVTFGVGLGGLLLLPAVNPVVWVVSLGLGPFLIQMVLILLAVRTASARETAALSGFVQSLGFGVGALGPPLIGWAHSATGAWDLPLALLIAALAAPIWGVFVLRRIDKAKSPIG